MEVIIKDKKLVIITKPEIIHFDLPKGIVNNLKYETDFIIKHISAENTIKNNISQLLSKYKHGHKFMNTVNSKANELHKFVLILLQRLDLISSNKHASLQYFSVY